MALTWHSRRRHWKSRRRHKWWWHSGRHRHARSPIRIKSLSCILGKYVIRNNFTFHRALIIKSVGRENDKTHRISSISKLGLPAKFDSIVERCPCAFDRSNAFCEHLAVTGSKVKMALSAAAFRYRNDYEILPNRASNTYHSNRSSTCRGDGE